MRNSSAIRIGVLSVQHEGRPPFGKQTYFFEDMVRSIPHLEKEIFFFSPLDCQGNTSIIKGFQFLNQTWIKVESGIPSIIYDRAFSSDEKQKQHIEAVRQRMQNENRLILNPLALADLLNDKVAFHALMLEHHIPTLDTLPIESINSKRVLHQLPTGRYYVKPTYGSKGQGIYVIEKKANVFNLIDNLGKVRSYNSFQNLNGALQKAMGKEERYFIQEEAEIAHYLGAPFDIRVLVQNDNGDYRVTGKAVRIGPQNAMTSNLNSGGSAIPFIELDDFYMTHFNRSADSLSDEMDALCLRCADMLKDRFGDFCEIGFDVLITKNAGPIIIEGNAKPSRWVFVKIADYLAAKGEDNTYFLDRRKETVGLPMKYAEYVLNASSLKH